MEAEMKVKLVLGGEAVNIPKTDIGLGVAFLNVWIDGSGFTSASNSIGSLGYILLETPVVDVGDVGPDRQKLFANLHGQVVKYDIAPNVFFKDGGIARITMTISVQQDGGLVDQKIEFQADSCRGVSIVSNALSFSCEMLQMERQVAMADDASFLPDDAVAMASDNAPKGDDSGSGDQQPAAAVG
jgi:hypothetical protein